MSTPDMYMQPMLCFAQYKTSFACDRGACQHTCLHQSDWHEHRQCTLACYNQTWLHMQVNKQSTWKDWLAKQQLSHDTAHRPDINGCRVIGGAKDQLWCSVVPAQCIQRVTSCRCAADVGSYDNGSDSVIAGGCCKSHPEMPGNIGHAGVC